MAILRSKAQEVEEVPTSPEEIANISAFVYTVEKLRIQK